MFAHFARDVREHVALTGKIDTEHRSWQHLRDRAFHHDGGFLRHRGEYIPEAQPAQLAISTAIAARLREKRSANIRRAPDVSTMRQSVDVLQRW